VQLTRDRTLAVHDFVDASVDRVAGEAGEMRTLTERDMFRILDHECRDCHLWTLALYGLRRGEIAGLRGCGYTMRGIRARR
jgi:integrase